MVELLVVIVVIAVLMAMLLPAVMNARAASRRMQCMNNLHNLGIAMHAHVDSIGGYPSVGNFSAAGDGKLYHNWVVNLLPWLDRRDIGDQWEFAQPFNASGNARLSNIGVSVLECPDDISVEPGRSNLSYGVNMGFTFIPPGACPAAYHGMGRTAMDFNGNGVTCDNASVPSGTPNDLDVMLMLSLFISNNYPPGPEGTWRHTPNDVVDGMSNTLLIAENVRLGFDPAEPTLSTWSSPLERYCAFLMSGYICNTNKCSAGNVDYGRANDHTTAPYKFESINAGLRQSEGTAPWPSSFHSGGVNFVFCDGHVRFISENIAGAVYAALISPQGTRLRGALKQVLVDDGVY